MANELERLIAEAEKEQAKKPSMLDRAVNAAMDPGVFFGPLGWAVTRGTDRDYRDKFVDSAAFGFGDNIAGAENYLDALVAGRPTEGAYAEGRDAMREKLAAYDEAKPVESAIADISGALAAGGGLAKQGLTLMGSGAAKTAAQAGARGAAEAGAYGALHGAGRSDRDDVAGMLTGGAEGAVKGALVGGPLAAGTHGIVNMLTRSKGVKAVPALDALKRDADAAYARADDLNPPFPRFSEFKDGAFDAIKDSYTPGLYPKIDAALEKMETMSRQAYRANAGTRSAPMGGYKVGVPFWKDVKGLRKVIRAAAKSTDPEEKRLGVILSQGFDNFVETTAPTPDIRTARKLYGRWKRGKMVDDRVDMATRQAARTASGGNEKATILAKVDQILNNDKLRAGFSEADIALMRKMVLSPNESPDYYLRLVGKLSPSGNGLMAALMGVGGGAAAGITGNPLFVAPMAAGMGAKAVSDATTRRMADLLSAQVRGGGKPITTTSPILDIERYIAQAAGAKPERLGTAARYGKEGVVELVDQLMGGR